jgi:cell division protein FtsW
MTGAVTSITAARRMARSRAESSQRVTRRSVLLLVPVALLLIVGLGALLSASSVVSLRETGASDNLFYFKRQLAWAAVAVGALLVTMRIPHRVYERAALPIFAASVAGLVLVRLIGVERGGAQRWIEFGPISLQPSEFAKFGVVVFLAMVLSRREASMNKFGHFFWPVAGALGLVGFLVMLQPDMGTVLLIAAAAFAVMLASAVPLRWVGGTAAIAAGAAVVLARTEAYRWDRVTAFLDPFADRLDTGFQAVQSLVALGTGGWFGIGLGLSRARWSFLPNAHTDFIFSIIGEETGFAGSMVVVGLFMLFTTVGTIIALRAPDRFGRLLGIGVVAWISAQAIVNIGGAVALLPITGIPLPFMSFGGSALVTNMAAVGVLLSIARNPAPTK